MSQCSRGRKVEIISNYWFMSVTHSTWVWCSFEFITTSLSERMTKLWASFLNENNRNESIILAHDSSRTSNLFCSQPIVGEFVWTNNREDNNLYCRTYKWIVTVREFGKMAIESEGECEYTDWFVRMKEIPFHTLHSLQVILQSVFSVF